MIAFSTYEYNNLHLISSYQNLWVSQRSEPEIMRKRRRTNKYTGEIIKLTAAQVLSSIFELALPFFATSSIYRTSARRIHREIDEDKTNLKEKIHYLKKMGMIESFVENKETYYELTPKATSHIERIKYDDIKITRTRRWDKKWRIVIFDVPEDKKTGRDLFRRKIMSIGFRQIQKSVYVYPFECTEQMLKVSSFLNLSRFVTIVIAEIVQGEESMIENFLDEKILKNDDLL